MPFISDDEALAERIVASLPRNYPRGLLVTDLAVMLFVRGRVHTTISNIAEGLDLPQVTVSKWVARLKYLRYLSQGPLPGDGRCRVISLTTRGYRRIQKN